MKKKVLTLLGALAALGLAACDPAAPASSAPASTPASSQPAASSKPAESSKPASSKPASSSKPADPVADATGHIWAADTDVAADTEAGTVAFKKAVTTTPATDKAVRYKVNQSVVTYPEGSSRKTDTPEGYTKLSDNGQMLTFKFKSDKLSKGKLYLFGVMDNYSSNTNQGLYYNGKPNVEVKVNDAIVNIDDWANHTYADYLEEGGDNGNSKEGYVPVGDVVLKEGVNEVSYKRVQTRNMLIKDFVFVVEETTEWSDPTTVAADATAGTVAYKKYTNNLDGSIKIEFAALDGTMAEGSENKNGTPAGYLKLKSDGHSISYKFNFDANLDGKFYQRGMMDSYSSNKSCTYYTNSQGKNNEKALLNGFNVHEADYFTFLQKVTKENYEESLREVLGDDAKEAAELVPPAPVDPAYKLAIVEMGGDAKGSFNKVYSAAWFSYSHYNWSHLLAANGTPVWLYYFTKDNGSLGSAHGGEMPYAYGNLDAHKTKYDDSDYALSEHMMDCWVNFVRCGDPNGPYQELGDQAYPQWSRFNDAPDMVYEFGERVGMTEDPNRELHLLIDKYQQSLR